MDTDGLPRNWCERKVEQVLQKDFKVTLAALRSATSCSLFSRAAYAVLWLSQLLTNSELPKGLNVDIKKIVLLASFSSDACLDGIQLCARAMAVNISCQEKCMTLQLGSQYLYMEVDISPPQHCGSRKDFILLPQHHFVGSFIKA